MVEATEHEQVEILTTSGEDRRRIGRRWVLSVLAIQAIVLAVRMTGDWFLFYVGPPEESFVFAVIWVAQFAVWTAAGVLWPTSVVIAPLTVATACLAAAETRVRTLCCVAPSIALTGLPILFWSLAVSAVN